MNAAVKVKVKWIYIALSREISKALRHGSHSFTCKQHPPLPRKRSPDGATTDCGHLIATYYSFINPERIKD